MTHLRRREPIAPDSFDGRYFGVLRITQVIGRATPAWTDEAGTAEPRQAVQAGRLQIGQRLRGIEIKTCGKSDKILEVNAFDDDCPWCLTRDPSLTGWT